MAKQVKLATRPRVGSGKGEARALRRDGRVPAIAYGDGLDPTALSVDARELFRAFHTDAGANAILAIEVDGESHLALAREVHRHPVHRAILHVDFVTVSRLVKVTVDVRIHLTGESIGVEEGGVVTQELYSVSVEVLPLEVPDAVELDISQMAIGDVRRLGDLTLPDGVTLLDEPERTVVSVVVPTQEPVEDEATDEAGEEMAEGATAGEADEADADSASE